MPLLEQGWICVNPERAAQRSYALVMRDKSWQRTPSKGTGRQAGRQAGPKMLVWVKAEWEGAIGPRSWTELDGAGSWL
jgi:hypothetical protein